MKTFMEFVLNEVQILDPTEEMHQLAEKIASDAVRFLKTADNPKFSQNLGTYQFKDFEGNPRAVDVTVASSEEYGNASYKPYWAHFFKKGKMVVYAHRIVKSYDDDYAQYLQSMLERSILHEITHAADPRMANKMLKMAWIPAATAGGFAALSAVLSPMVATLVGSLSSVLFMHLFQGYKQGRGYVKDELEKSAFVNELAQIVRQNRKLLTPGTDEEFARQMHQKIMRQLDPRMTSELEKTGEIKEVSEWIWNKIQALVKSKAVAA